MVVLRHGQSVANAGGVWQGQLDAPLSELGRAQARAAARVLAATHRIARVLASDLARAADTGAAVAAACGVTHELEPGLREVHAGAWTGLRSTEILRAHPGLFDRLRAGEDVRRGGDGETVGEAVGRARPAVEQALAALPAGTTLVLATHGAIGRGIVAALAGMDAVSHWGSFSGLENAAWAELDASGDGRWRPVGWNVAAP